MSKVFERKQSVWYMCASLAVYFLLTSNLMDSVILAGKKYMRTE